MTKLSSYSILICLGLLIVGNLAGWAIAEMFVGEAASRDFLEFGTVAAAIIFLMQVLVFGFCKKGVSGEFIFRGVSGFSLIWFLLSLVLPLVWVKDFGFQVKFTLIGLSLLLFAFNFEKGRRHFNKQWERQAPSIEKTLKKNSPALEWEEVGKILALSVSMHIPGVPKMLEPVLSVLFAVSMIAGLNLRKIFPIFSMFAWGIPCVVASSMLVQMIAFNFLQGAKIRKLEKERGIKFRSSLKSHG